MLLRYCCRFWQQCCGFRQQCRTKFLPFDNVETNWTYSICFDIVKRTKFYNRIVRHCCRLWQQSRMLLRHCCWCGRGLSRRDHVNQSRIRIDAFYDTINPVPRLSAVRRTNSCILITVSIRGEWPTSALLVKMGLSRRLPSDSETCFFPGFVQQSCRLTKLMKVLQPSFVGLFDVVGRRHLPTTRMS